MISRSRLATCALIRITLGLGLALSTGATAPLAAIVNTEVRMRADYYPATDGDGLGGRMRLKTGVRHDFADVRLKAELLASRTESPWGSGSLLELGDAHVTWINEHGTFRLGHQQIAWGRADAFRLLDSVNPQRYPDAFFDETADARIPLWMANWEAQTGAWQWQILAGHDRRLNGSDPAFSQFQPSGEHSPKTSGSADFGGFRVGTQIGPLDLALHGLSGPEPQALWRPDSLGRVTQLSARRRLWGLSGDWAAGPVVLRGELVHTNTDTVDEQMQSVAQRNFQALLGADWEQDAWFLSPQLYWETNSPQRYTSDRNNSLFSSLLMQRKMLQDRLKLRAFWLHGFDTSEDWWSLTVSYETNDHLAWRLGLDHFRVDQASLLSALKDTHHLSLEAVMRF